MVWWKHNRQACQSGQAEGPMPTPLPCPLCNGHAEAVMDSWTSGGYGYDFERWGCRCGECGYGHVETSGHEPRMGTVEIFERHRNHCGYHAACDKPADVNSHNTHPNRKEENQCSGSLSQ